MGGKKEMKRIIGTLVAFGAVLALSAAANAAAVVFNVAGTGKVQSASQYATAPTPGQCCLDAPYGAGSQVTVDITGGSVSLTSGILFVNTFLDLSVLQISTDVDVALSGGSGALAGD